MFIPFFNLGFMSNSLVFMLCYVWSKNFATTPCSLYGLMTIQVPPVRMLKCISCRSVDRLPWHMLHDGVRHQTSTIVTRTLASGAGLLSAVRVCGLQVGCVSSCLLIS